MAKRRRKTQHTRHARKVQRRLDYPPRIIAFRFQPKAGSRNAREQLEAFGKQISEQDDCMGVYVTLVDEPWCRAVGITSGKIKKRVLRVLRADTRISSIEILSEFLYRKKYEQEVSGGPSATVSSS